MKHDVCALADLPETGMTEVEIDGLKVLLIRDGDTVHATGAICTHKGAPLKNGTRIGSRVICPWHHAIFDLTSGDHIEPPGQGCLNHFSTEIAAGRVHVDIPEGASVHRPEVDPAARKAGGDRLFAIVGAGAAGVACAQELVRRGFDGRIVLFGDEGEPPYDRTDLSKAYMQGKKSDADLPLLGDGGLDAIGVERMTEPVARIDRATRTIQFRDKDGVNAGLVYDKCFAAPGSRAGTLPLDNAGLPNVFTLRSHDDAKAIKGAVDAANRIVIIGSGFIGMEVAAGLIQNGKTVTLISRETLPFASKFGEAVAGQIAAQHRAKGVDLRTNSVVSELEEKHGKVETVHLADGTRIPADVVLIAVGASPRLEIFGDDIEGGLDVAADLSVDASLFAGGDVANFPLAGRNYSTRIEHWRVAEQHGRHAAAAMLGEAGTFDGVPFFWSAQYGPIHYVGNARSYDDIHIEGDLEAGNYTAFYIVAGRVVAALGRGKADTTADLHAVMLSDRTPAVADLAAVDWQPARLLN
ncbi:FAD-dependent oxidoreductase [Aurantimonas manganoxydans]|nr:FAD-dependent oxidoreductase [Aurantimonas manganoxydans]